MVASKYMPLDGANSVSQAMRQINPDVVAAYPITPQTAIVQKFSEFVADGLIDTEFVPVESEHAAMSTAIGACAGTVLANAMFELPLIELSTKTRSSGALWLSEVIATIGLLLFIQGCVRTGRARAVPFAVGAWIGGAYWFTSSTSFANPAVTVARTLSDSFAGIEPASAPMFIAMQIIGAGIAYGLVRLFYPHLIDDPTA